MIRLEKLLITVGVIVLFSIQSSAQMDERAPGLYSVVDGQSSPMTFMNGSASVAALDNHGIEVTCSVYKYEGISSEVKADSTFVLVINPEVKKTVRKLKEYYPFVKSMKPSRVMIAPLLVDTEDQCRYFCPGFRMEMFKVGDGGQMKFDWKKISDNSFEITVHGLEPGEYAIFFRPESSVDHDYTAAFDFTVLSNS